jgi:hypothetical protein
MLLLFQAPFEQHNPAVHCLVAQPHPSTPQTNYKTINKTWYGADTQHTKLVKVN